MKIKIFCDNATAVEQQYNEWCNDKTVDKTLLSMTNELITLAIWYKEIKEEKNNIKLETYVCSCGQKINLNDNKYRLKDIIDCPNCGKIIIIDCE